MKVIVPNKLTLNQCSVAETDAVDGVAWSSSTTYSKGAMVRYNHVSYKSLDDGNSGNNPANTWSGEEAKWQKIGATMPYRMLDEYVETQTEAPAGAPLTFTVPFNRATSFALLNLQGANARVVITDTDEDPDEILLDEEFSLLTDIGQLSLFDYYFEPLSSLESFIRTEMPLALTGTLHVELYPGDDTIQAKIGHVIVGRARYLGMTKYDAEVGITDYSRKTTDEFGVTTLVRRSFAKTASLPLYLHPDSSDSVTKVLQDIRATPCVFQGDNMDSGYAALTMYGWLEDWRHVFAGPNEVELNLDIQGLI